MLAVFEYHAETASAAWCSRQPVFKLQALANEHRRLGMLWTILVILLILWLLGFSLHIGGALIHLLLVVGLVVLVVNLLSGRTAV